MIILIFLKGQNKYMLIKHLYEEYNFLSISSRRFIFFFINFSPFPNKPWFLRVCFKSLLKTLWEKEKLLVASNFSFSHSVFNPFRKLPVIFIKFKIVVCKTLSIWKSLKFVVWERVNIVNKILQRLSYYP